MSKSNIIELAGRDTIIDPLAELLRTGAERLIYQAVEAELQERSIWNDVQRMARPGWCATVIFQPASCKRE